MTTKRHPTRSTRARAVDYVDRFSVEWESRRPDLDIGRLSPLMRVLRLSSLLEKELTLIAREQSITSAQFQVLAALRRHDPEPQSLSELTRIAILTSGSMTSLVDRLEERNLVRRRPHPEDRRGVLLTLTEAGRKTVDATLGTRVRRLHELADVLSKDELARVAQALRKLLLAVDSPSAGGT